MTTNLERMAEIERAVRNNYAVDHTWVARALAFLAPLARRALEAEAAPDAVEAAIKAMLKEAQQIAIQNAEDGSRPLADADDPRIMRAALAAVLGGDAPGPILPRAGL